MKASSLLDDSASLFLVVILMIRSNFIYARRVSFSDNDCKALRAKFDKMCPVVSPPVTRIVGGRRARLEESKFMVRIGYGQRKNIEYQCGGSLIHERWVLSAAHCALEKSSGIPKFVKVQSNAIHEVEQHIAHPDFIENRSYNDLLLLRLKEPVAFNCKIQPVCLHTASKINSKAASVLGWGRTGLDSDPSNSLLTATVKMFTNRFCNKLYASVLKLSRGMIAKGILKNIQICAGTLSGKKDTCLGDSGGPLVISRKRSSLRTQIGVTSFGYGCGAANYPGIYVRISHFVPWIESVVNGQYDGKGVRVSGGSKS